MSMTVTMNNTKILSKIIFAFVLLVNINNVTAKNNIAITLEIFNTSSCNESISLANYTVGNHCLCINSDSNCKEDVVTSEDFLNLKYNNYSIADSCNISFLNSSNMCIDCNDFTMMYNYSFDKDCLSKTLMISLFILSLLCIIFFILIIVCCIKYCKMKQKSNYDSL